MKITLRQLAKFLHDNPTTKNVKLVASFLVSNGRRKEAIAIVREVESMLSQEGRIVARVKSAHKLQESEQKEIIRMLKNDHGAKSVEIINEIDPSLLGGVIVRTPNMEVDLSVQSKLNKLKLKTNAPR